MSAERKSSGDRLYLLLSAFSAASRSSRHHRIEFLGLDDVAVAPLEEVAVDVRREVGDEQHAVAGAWPMSIVTDVPSVFVTRPIIASGRFTHW